MGSIGETTRLQENLGDAHLPQAILGEKQCQQTIPSDAQRP